MRFAQESIPVKSMLVPLVVFCAVARTIRGVATPAWVSVPSNAPLPVVPSVKVTMPDESIKEIVASLGDDGTLLFNAAAPENPNQYTIDDINADKPGSGEIVPMRRDGRAKAAGE